MLLMALTVAASAATLHVEKTGRVGRKIETDFLVADLSQRVINGKQEDSGTLRALTYKQFGVTLFRHPANGRMHKGASLQRAGAPGYKDLGTWDPVQEIREEETGGAYVHRRAGYFADYPEVKMEVDYSFFADAPYFLVMTRMTVEKPLAVVLVRNNEMTMNLFFTHVAWPGRDGQVHIATFEERRPLLQKEPLSAEIPWLAFLNLDKGFGYGYVMVDSKNSKTVNPGTSISDGVWARAEMEQRFAEGLGTANGKYWSRHMISGRETPLVPGDRFEERSAYVLFKCSKDQPLSELFDWQKKILAQF
ncbi:MAG: hypothetical protein EHM65_02085, partial [Acidobacteriales bacterium]